MCYEGKCHEECKYGCTLFLLYDGCEEVQEARAMFEDDEDRYL